MPKITDQSVKNDHVTIQFRISNEEYAEIQRVKIQEGKARESNQQYYKDVLFRGLQKNSLKL
jgi:hypothetical protein